eukprot:4233336-Prymnesium_polylepis.1
MDAPTLVALLVGALLIYILLRPAQTTQPHGSAVDDEALRAARLARLGKTHDEAVELAATERARAAAAADEARAAAAAER